jgi:FKBP-type peptidyl-prolyl cis-trans isomerase 2
MVCDFVAVTIKKQLDLNHFKSGQVLLFTGELLEVDVSDEEDIVLRVSSVASQFSVHRSVDTESPCSSKFEDCS